MKYLYEGMWGETAIIPKEDVKLITDTPPDELPIYEDRFKEGYTASVHRPSHIIGKAWRTRMK